MLRDASPVESMTGCGRLSHCTERDDWKHDYSGIKGDAKSRNSEAAS